MSDIQYQHLPQSVLLPYTGGHTVILDGYVLELCPDHPSANPYGFVLQHRLVVERHLGRFLTPLEVVHHKDMNPSNNDIDNLQVMSRREHMTLHRAFQREEKYFDPLTRESVEFALSQGGLKAAAKLLGCSTETIRNNFPDLVEPYKRKSPANLHLEEWVDKIKSLASDPQIGYREASEILGISISSIVRVCERHNIEWVKKSKVGEKHSTYVRKGQNYHDDPALVEQIRSCAVDNTCSYREASHKLGMSEMKIQRIAKRNGIQWISKPVNRYPRDDE